MPHSHLPVGDESFRLRNENYESFRMMSHAELVVGFSPEMNFAFKIREQVNFERVIIVPFSGKPLPHGYEDCSTQFGIDTEVDVGSLPAEDRFGVGRYPFRVRMWYFFERSPTSCTLIERHPRLGFGLG
jgi:hypothetical protein